jgi:CRISPR-associated exonuclease Cas4
MINLRVSDLKQYFYCRRIIYYTYCMPLPRPVTHPMQVGAVEHEVISVLERRRSLKRYGLGSRGEDLRGEYKFHVQMQAESLGLTGVLDMLIITQEKAFPVEFKYTDQRINMNAKYQLVAYGMMAEEFLESTVDYGFICRIPQKSITTIPISSLLRQNVSSALDDIREMITRERMPDPTRQRGKCVECEFRRYCRDVL